MSPVVGCLTSCGCASYRRTLISRTHRRRSAQACRKKGNNDAPAMDTIDSFVARNAADGEALADKVAQKLLQYENTPWFVGMLKSLVKHSTTNLSTDDAKELATSVQVLANDKLKAEREKQKGKKKPTAASKKASITQSHNPAFEDVDDYGDDDFM
mmetsp:Transcript_9041/g.23020  ORF Transcript_9041/g.23020 Transcript_9041/m.23020 type:complete len:156 (+) Transcript_9041:397-864(+)